jgi:hypothetical protein
MPELALATEAADVDDAGLWGDTGVSELGP